MTAKKPTTTTPTTPPATAPDRKRSPSRASRGAAASAAAQLAAPPAPATHTCTPNCACKSPGYQPDAPLTPDALAAADQIDAAARDAATPAPDAPAAAAAAAAAAAPEPQPEPDAPKPPKPMTATAAKAFVASALIDAAAGMITGWEHPEITKEAAAEITAQICSYYPGSAWRSDVLPPPVLLSFGGRREIAKKR
jgi:hypothetical protein